MSERQGADGNTTWLARRDLVSRLAERAAVSRREAEDLLRALEEVVGDALSGLESVRLQGIGTLRPTWRGPTVVRSPHDRRRMFVDGRWHLTFRPSTIIRGRLAAQLPAHFRDERHQRAWRLAETLLGDLAAYHPDRVPAGIQGRSGDAETRAACEATFGAEWVRVARTWAERTPDEVVTARDHLASAARTRWGKSP